MFKVFLSVCVFAPQQHSSRSSRDESKLKCNTAACCSWGALPSPRVCFFPDFLAFPAVVASQLRMGQLTVSAAAEIAARAKLPDRVKQKFVGLLWRCIFMLCRALLMCITAQ